MGRAPRYKHEIAALRKNSCERLHIPKHWLGYIAIKFIVLALGVYLVLRWKGVL
jgi:hypothetical protein